MVFKENEKASPLYMYIISSIVRYIYVLFTDEQQQKKNIIGKLAAIKLIRPHINETPFNHHAKFYVYIILILGMCAVLCTKKKDYIFVFTNFISKPILKYVGCVLCVDVLKQWSIIDEKNKKIFGHNLKMINYKIIYAFGKFVLTLIGVGVILTTGKKSIKY